MTSASHSVDKSLVIARIVAFLEAIGLTVRMGHTSDTTILPGIAIHRGGLLLDLSKLRYDGDLLHEAGHLAVLPIAERTITGEDTGHDGGAEMAAIAWSYAAAVHLDLDLRVVFHSDGYRGGSQAILENFQEGRYIGVPLLQWMGLTGCDYPQMIRWLRE